MKIYFSAALFIIALSGCRSFDLTMNSPEQYRSLDSSSVTIGTIDSVLVLKPGIKNAAWKRAYMPEVSLPWQKVKNDTIFYSGKQISIAVPLKSISFIKCRGVWDEEAGFISEKEIKQNYEGSISIITPLLMGIGGIPIGGIIGYAMPRDRSGWFDGMAETLAGSLIGLAAGIIAGILLEKEWEYDNVIERIIETRINKTPKRKPENK